MKSINAILVSVIMPNYNTPIEYLQESINSILNQTYTNFELIIVDDQSTNGSYDFLLTLTDPRIKIYRNEKNLGCTASLNIALQMAQGEYIARMDSDDISSPHRFERQLEYMDRHPDTVVCGTWGIEIGDGSRKLCRKIPKKKMYQCGVLFGNIYGLIHPSAFFRAAVLRENNLYYDENIPTAQDYAMWAECCRYGSVDNVEEYLFQYRIHGSQISSTKKELQKNCTMYTIKKQLLHIMPEITDTEITNHYAYCISNIVTKEMRQWFHRIVLENESVGYVDGDSLRQFVELFLRQKIDAASTVASSPKAIVKLLSTCVNYSERKIVLRNVSKRIARKLRNLKTRKNVAGKGTLAVMKGAAYENYGKLTITQGILRIGKKNWKTDNRTSGIFVAKDAKIIVEDSFSVFSGSYICVNEGASLIIGGRGYINHNASIDCFQKISIGEDTIISKNVTIRDSDNHCINGTREIAAPIVIGKRVWIGMNVTILKGVTIGDGSVIGANTVVNRDIPPNCLAVGNPCRVVKNGISWI